MKQFLILITVTLFILLLPATSNAQPIPPHYGPGWHLVERCYTVLFPYPHSRCEYVYVRRNYTPVPPVRHYRPLPPPPPRHRPGHHPPPPPPPSHYHR